MVVEIAQCWGSLKSATQDLGVLVVHTNPRKQIWVKIHVCTFVGAGFNELAGEFLDFSPNSLLLGVLNSFLRCVRLFVTGGVRLSGLVCALSPFICLASCEGSLPEWWCPPLRSCPVLCVPCLPSFVSLHVKGVSLSGGVRLAGLVCALSPFICLPHVSPRVVVSASPILSVPCLPSFVSLHVSP